MEPCKNKMKFIKGCPALVNCFALISQVFVVGQLLQDARLNVIHKYFLLYIAPTTYWKLHAWQYPIWPFFNLSKAGDILQYVRQKQKKEKETNITQQTPTNKHHRENQDWLASALSSYKIQYCTMPSIIFRLRLLWLYCTSDAFANWVEEIPF